MSLDIQNEIKAAKETNANLSELTSSSATSWWWNLVVLVSDAIGTLEQLLIAHKAEVDQKVQSSWIGSRPWWPDMAQRYQHGHALVVRDNIPVYLQEDIASKIISRVSVTTKEGVVLVKVAKGDQELSELSLEEKTGFENYIDRMKPPGVKSSVVSLLGDLVLLNAYVYYDNLLQEADVRQTMESNIQDFLKQVPFNGRLYKQQLIDVIQNTPGVTDVDLQSLSTKPYNGYFTTSGRYVEPLAGWFKIDPDNALADTITLTPES